MQSRCRRNSQCAADLAILKFGYWDRYNEVAARLEPVISRRELDRLVDSQNQVYGPAPAMPSITATPFLLPDPKSIEPRAWLYDHHFIRKYLSTTVAPGGLGKTSLLTVEAVAMVTGRNLLGEKPKKPLRVWYWNGEDPIDEMVRRITAVCEHYQITRADLGDRLFVNSGRETEILVARQDRNGIVVAEPVMAALRNTIRDRRIDVVIIDPFVASHAVPENDNIALNAVCWQWRMLVEETGCAVELVHHVRKRAPGQGEFLVDDARGAGAMTNAARSARVLNNMTKDEASKAGLPSPSDFFRVDKGKANNARKSEGATWRRIISVPLGNGRGPSEPGDFVGVVTEWKWPDPEDDVMPDDICAIHQALAEGEWRENAQASNWVGKLVAQQLGLDLGEPFAKAKVKALVKTWLDTGILKLVERPDARRKLRKFVEAGKKGPQ